MMNRMRPASVGLGLLLTVIARRVKRRSGAMDDRRADG